MLGQKPKAPVGATRSKPGTFNDLISRYYKSSAFTTLAESTRNTYRSQIEAFRKEHGDKPVSALKAKHVDAILGKVAETSTAQAHKLRKRLSTLMRLAVKWEFTRDNPILNAERISHKTKGYETWSESEVERFRDHWPEGTAQRLAFELMLYTGLRRSDVVRLGRGHIQGDYTVISTKKAKKWWNSTFLSTPIFGTFWTLSRTTMND